MTKIGTFYLCYAFSILFFWNQFPFTIFVLHFGIHILVPGIFWALKKNRQSQFYKEFLRFSSLLLIKMKMGFAFRSSYENCMAHTQWKYASLLEELYRDVVFSPQKTRRRAGSFDNFLGQCENVFRKMDQNPGASIEQLYTFRKELIHRDKFRRKSGHIWSQIVSQWVIISGIYLGFLIYTLTKFSIYEHKKTFLLSFSLHGLGIVCLIFLRKVPKWKL